MASSTLFVLTVTPALYSLFERTNVLGGIATVVLVLAGFVLAPLLLIPETPSIDAIADARIMLVVLTAAIGFVGGRLAGGVRIGFLVWFFVGYPIVIAAVTNGWWMLLWIAAPLLVGAIGGGLTERMKLFVRPERSEVIPAT